MPGKPDPMGVFSNTTQFSGSQWTLTPCPTVELSPGTACLELAPAPGVRAQAQTSPLWTQVQVVTFASNRLQMRGPEAAP